MANGPLTSRSSCLSPGQGPGARGFLRALTIAFLVGAAVSFFMPLVKVRVPGMGMHAVSGFDAVMQMRQAAPVRGSACASCGDAGVDVREVLRTLLENRSYGLEYGFIVLGLVCGLLAYALLPLLALAQALGKTLLMYRTSVCALFLSLIFAAAFFLMNSMFREQMQRSVQALQKDPLVSLAAAFIGGIGVEPGPAVYCLVCAVFLIVIFTRASLRDEEPPHLVRNAGGNE